VLERGPQGINQLAHAVTGCCRSLKILLLNMPESAAQNQKISSLFQILYAQSA